MIIKSSLKSMLLRPANALGTLLTVIITVTSMSALITILVATADSSGQSYLFADADIVVAVDQVEEFRIEAAAPGEFDIRVNDDERARIAALDGVNEVVQFNQVPMTITSRNGDVVAINAVPTSVADGADLELVAGAQPESDTQIMIPETVADAVNLHVGDPIQVSAVMGVDEFTISGLFRSPHQLHQFAFVSDSVILQQSGPGASALLVSLDEGVDTGTIQTQIEDGQRALSASTGDERAVLDPSSDSAAITEFGELMGVMAGFLGTVAIFVLGSTIGFSIQQRHQVFAQ